MNEIRIEGDTAIIVLTNGGECVIDAADLPLVKGMTWRGKWYGGKRGRNRYAVTDRRTQGIHRIIMGVHGRSEHVDHIDQDPMNNRRSNLRVCTAQQNNANRPIQKNNESGFRGVRRGRGGRWVAMAWIDRKPKRLGTFTCASVAAMVRDLEMLRLHGEYAALNYPWIATPGLGTPWAIHYRAALI